MPIGKNAIKRVESNGYSSVKTEAPDMENSTVAEKNSTVAKKAPAPKKPGTAPKKVATAPKKVAPAPKKSVETEQELSPATAKRVTKKTAKAPKKECDYIAIGEELPFYLL